MAWLSALWREVEVSAPEGPDGLAVRFTLKQPFSPFLDYTTIGLLPAHLWEQVPVADMMSSQYNTRPIGTGPLQLDRITATQVDLEVNPALSRRVALPGGDHRPLLPRSSEPDARVRARGDRCDQLGLARGYAGGDGPRGPAAVLRAHFRVHADLPQPANPNVPFFKETGGAPGADVRAGPAEADRHGDARPGPHRAFADHARQLGLRCRCQAVRLRSRAGEAVARCRPAGWTATATACATGKA